MAIDLLNPIEFICRGQIRAEKDYALDNAAAYDKTVRQEVKRLVQQLWQEMEKNDERLDAHVKKAAPQPESAGSCSKFCEWLSGARRESYIILQRDIASEHLSEALTIRRRLSDIGRIAEQYEKTALRYQNTGQDAVNHNIRCKSGWTWWR